MPLVEYNEGRITEELSTRQRDELFRHMIECTVAIEIEIINQENQEQHVRGGGVIINEKGLVLTSCLIVKDDASLILINLSNEKKFVGKVLSSNPYYGYALIQILQQGNVKFLYASISKEKLRIKQEVMWIGNSLTALPFYCQFSNLYCESKPTYTRSGLYWFNELHAAIGSPIFNSVGRIVSLHSGEYDGSICGPSDLNLSELSHAA